jgi:pimeloyl-ACP methyl ester carboxylesterase
MQVLDRTQPAVPKLDPREQHVRIPSPIEGLDLFLRHLPPPAPMRCPPRVVLYVHGGTFPSGLSMAHRFDGRSWRDDLCARGFDVWGLDFLGFGASDRYPQMSRPADAGAALGSAEAASRQLESAVRWISAHHGVPRISIIAHSWGTIVAGRFAGACAGLVERLVFFGPVGRRKPTGGPQRYPAWRLVSLDDQWKRFTEDVPAGESPVPPRRHFDAWGSLYLDTDPDSRTRSRASVRTPSGPWQDIADAWAGRLAYDPGLVRAPVAIIRGEWDSLTTDNDARWLFDALRASARRRDVKIARATHLMHLEENRYVLYREAEGFLLGGDLPATSGG